MQGRTYANLKGVFRVFMYLPSQVDPKLPLWGLQVLLHVASADGPCVCMDIMQEFGIRHDDLRQLTKSFQRSAKAGPRPGYDLLVLKPHPTDKRQHLAELSEHGQQIVDGMMTKFIGPRGHPLA